LARNGAGKDVFATEGDVGSLVDLP